MIRMMQLGAGTALLVSLSACTSNTVIPGSTCVGNCVNGQGTLNRQGATETGTFVLGQRTGNFEVASPNGDILTVPMLNGVAHGSGIIRRTNGTQFEQRFAFGQPVEGTSMRDNGDRFDGTFQTVMMPRLPDASAGLPAYAMVPYVAPVTLFKRGVYASVSGQRYDGEFSLAGDRLVFTGTLRDAKGKTQPFMGAALFLPGTRAGYEFAAAQRKQIAAWSADHDKRMQAYKETAPAQQTAVVAAAAPVAALAQPLAAATPARTATFNILENNTGRYLSPITSDGVAAAWVDKSINASLGASVGGLAGAYAGQKALEQVPFVGGFLGRKAGAAVGRNVALSAVGGEAYLRDTSDISFNDINEMAGWLVQNHRSHAKFAEIMKAAGQIYPELTPAYLTALRTVR